MNAAVDTNSPVRDFPSCKIINCVMPDNGTDRRILLELRKKFGIVNATSSTGRGVGFLGRVKTKPGKLPHSRLVKKLHVICPVDQVEEVFDFIFWFAEFDKPEMGAMWQQDVTGCSPYELPPDIPDEETGA